MGSSRGGAETVLHRLVYEMRYEYGHTYLDKCGATVKELLVESPGWFFSEASPTGAGILRNPTLNMEFQFGVKKLDLSQNQSAKYPALKDTDEFIRVADSFTDTVLRNLDISIVTRIGFRSWNLIGFDSPEAVQEEIRKLRIVQLGDTEELGGDLTDLNFAFVLDRDTHKTRVAVVGGEQNIPIDRSTIESARAVPHKLASGQDKALIQKLKAERALKMFPLYFVAVDIDYFIENPPWPEGPRVLDFLEERLDENAVLVQKVLRPR